LQKLSVCFWTYFWLLTPLIWTVIPLTLLTNKLSVGDFWTADCLLCKTACELSVNFSGAEIIEMYEEFSSNINYHIVYKAQYNVEDFSFTYVYLCHLLSVDLRSVCSYLYVTMTRMWVFSF